MLVSIASAQMQYPKERNSLVARDNNTLLDPAFLPFLIECNKPNGTTPIQLCTMYYDMVYNAYELGAKGVDTRQAIQKADKALDNQQLVDKFCEIFRNETIQTLTKQPFSQANGYNVTEWIQLKYACEINCLKNGKPPMTNVFTIQQICKFISGGLKWIGEQNQKLYLSSLPSPNTNAIAGGTINDNANGVGKVDANAIVNEMNNAPPKAVVNANANANVNGSPVQNPRQNSPSDAITNAKSSLNADPKGKPNSKTTQETQISRQVELSIPAAQQPPRQLPGSVTPSLNKTTPSNLTANNNKVSNSNNIEAKIVQPPPAAPKPTDLPLDNNQSEDELEGNEKNKADIDDENQENEGNEWQVEHSSLCVDFP